ncbi:MAG: PA14 domain-containing protein [Sedimentisphaerales bacterium]
MRAKLIQLVSFVFILGFCGAIAGAQENQIVNGEFDDGLDSWGIYAYLNTAEGFDVEVVQGAGLSGENAAMLDIYDSTALTSIGIAQGGLVFEPGETYPICFTAKADVTRGLVVLIQGNINNSSYPTFLDQTVELTTKRKDYTIEYTHTGNAIGAGENEDLILYLMIKGPSWSPPGANLNGKVWIDRVCVGADVPRQPVYEATSPTPEDGAALLDTWVTLGWSPGDLAASHDVYLGDDFDLVNEGADETFRGNQPTNYFVAGFPGFPYPEGLTPGTTYYWRIDEVNDLNADSPWRGPVWSFTVPAKKAYAPNPPNGAKFVDPAPTLAWTAGYGAKLHTVYFGDNAADVEAGTGDTSKGSAATTSFAPGALEPNKTYYWRIDEFDGATTHTGDVWNFTIAKEGGGLKAEYYNNATLTGVPALVRIDPEIDFGWGNATTRGVNSPAPNINVDNFSARWSGELEVDLTDTYIFRVTANNGFRLWLDDRLIIDFWGNPTTSTLESDPIDLIGGTTCNIRMEYYEGADTATARLFWECSQRERQIIPQAALSPPGKANRPSPTNGTVGTKLQTVLTWVAGDDATSHEVYFGADAEAVKSATKASPEFKATKPLGDESYDPGPLAWDTTYYWRVDEVNDLNPDSPWVGVLWSFSTGDFLLVDDFESYTNDDAAGQAIWQSWIDGFGIADNGAQVGYLVPPYAEQITVHGGVQSMPLLYTNTAGVENSEGVLTLTTPRDWTAEGVGELSLWFIGDPANAPEPMYVALSNANGTSAIVANDDANAATTDTWTEWVIPLTAFADQGVNLADVDKIAIGLGAKGNVAAPGGKGTVYFDDIRLYRP